MLEASRHWIVMVLRSHNGSSVRSFASGGLYILIEAHQNTLVTVPLGKLIDTRSLSPPGKNATLPKSTESFLFGSGQ